MQEGRAGGVEPVCPVEPLLWAGSASRRREKGRRKACQRRKRERKAEVWGKRLHGIRGKAERTGGKDEVGKHGCTGKRVLNAVENRTSLEGSNERGAGDKGERVRAPLGV